METAVEYDKKSIKLYEELGDLKGVAINLVGIGIYFSDVKKDNYEAFNYYQRAQNIFEDNGYKTQIPYSLQNMASTEINLGRFESAISNYDKLAKLFEELGYGEKRVHSIFNKKAYVMSITGDHEGASVIYENGLELHEKLENKEDILYSLNNIGISSYLNENYEKALEYLERANELSKGVESPGNALATELYLKLCYQHFG